MLTATATKPQAPARSNRRWWVLATMTGSLSMIMIDQTVVSVALPTMQHDLSLSTSGLQWVVNAYLLSLAVLVALGGRIADLLGAERTFRVGAVVFVTASALCGLAGSELAIIASRALQGAGAAMMVPATSAIILNAFGQSERGKAMGIYSGVSMIFLALGPLVGGLLTQSVTWRAVFFINLPIGLAMLVAAHKTLPSPPLRRIRRDAIDWVGIPLLIGGLGSLVLALMQGQSWGWGSPVVIGLFGIAAVLLPSFVLWERRQAHPLVQLSLLRLQNFKIDSTVLAGVQFALTGVSVFGAIFGQEVLGYGPTRAGLSMLPLTLPLLVVAPLAGRLYDRIGPRALLTGGSLLIAAGLSWSAIWLHEREYILLVPGYVALGCGLGMSISPGTTDALGAAAPGDRSQASGLLQTLRQVGGTVGIAVLGAVVAAVSVVGPHADAEAHLNAATSGVAAAYWVGAGVMAALAVAAFVLVRRRES
jgi:EmrB/QacA subfamily drug resistance transporter